MAATSVGVAQVRQDLRSEQESLDRIVAELTAEQWSRPTPSERWTVAHQIAHLAYFDRAAATAITDPESFAPMVDELFTTAGGGDGAVDEFTLGPYLRGTPDDLLVAWRADRAALAEASTKLEDDTRVLWYGPSMGAKSFLTARLMEAWAHGQDIADAIGATREPTDRLRHIAQLGYLTRGWSYANRGMEMPPTDVSVRLTAPSGADWAFGPDDAPESITGPAEDFCLVTTQRRNIDDTSLVVSGDAAHDWMVRAQAFAGPATDGPARDS